MFLSASMCRSSRTACWSTAPGAAWCGTVTLGGCSPCRSTLDTWETSPFTTPHWVSNTHRSKRRRTHIYCTHQCSSELLVRKDSFIIHHSSTKYFVLYKKRHSLDFGPAASVDSDLVWTAEIWPPTLIYCPPRMAVSSSKWSGGMDLWRMFVLVLLTHQPVHHRFSSQHCYRCRRRYGSAAPSSPPTTYLWPGNLSIPHFFTPSSSSAATNIHTHTQAANIQIQLMEHPGRRANIKMDEQGDRFGLQRRQVYFFVNGEAIKTQTFFSRWLVTDG